MVDQITDICFNLVINDWFATTPNGTAAEFTNSSNDPYYGSIENWNTSI